MCSASEAEDHDLHLLVSLVETIREARCCRLIDYSGHFEARDLPSILGCLTLVVVEVGRDGYDGFLHGPSHERLGVSLYLLKDEGGYLLWTVLFSIDPDLIVAASHLPFDLTDCTLRIGSRLPNSRFSHDHLPILRDGYNRREHFACGSLSLSARDDDWPASLHNRGCAVRCS